MKNTTYFNPYTFVLLLCSILVTSCSTTISAHRVVPAEAHELANVTNIAVAPFQYAGTDNKASTSLIEATLVNTKVAGKPYFRLVERSKIDLLIDELRLEQRGLRGFFDERSAAALRSKLSRSDAILFGEITYDEIDLDTYTGVTVDDRPINCVKKTATFTFLPKFMSITTGAILYSKEFTGAASSNECAGGTGALDIELSRTARNEALAEFERAVAPYSISEKIMLLTEFCSENEQGKFKKAFSSMIPKTPCDNSMPSAEVRDLVLGGAKFANANRMDRACEIWGTAAKLHSRGFVLPFLKGVCAEVVEENLRFARRLFEEADRNTIEPVGAINAALARIDDKYANDKMVTKQISKTGPKPSLTVRKAQNKLNELGYNAGPADGFLGNRTNEAIRAYQQDSGLKPSGILDSHTKRSLDTT